MVQISFATFAVIAGVLSQTALAAPLEKRAASCSFPNPSASTNVKLSAARTIKAGESFDGKSGTPVRLCTHPHARIDL
jgi:hypothetical protein